MIVVPVYKRWEEFLLLVSWHSYLFLLPEHISGREEAGTEFVRRAISSHCCNYSWQTSQSRLIGNASRDCNVSLVPEILTLLSCALFFSRRGVQIYVFKCLSKKLSENLHFHPSFIELFLSSFVCFSDEIMVKNTLEISYFVSFLSDL